MPRRFTTLIAALLCALLLAAPAADARTLVFRIRIKGLIADAAWTTCPDPQEGDLCKDVVVFGFDTKDRDRKLRSRTPVLRILTFVYRFVDDPEDPADPVAQWFGRLEGGQVSGDPRLQHASATGRVPIQVCTVIDRSAGVRCPDHHDVAVRWTGQGDRSRVYEHTVNHETFRLVNAWTRGWERGARASGTVDGAPIPGVFLGAGLARIDQGETIVQHPVG